MDEIKRTDSWKNALALAKELVSVGEEFSDSETNVLAHHIRQAIADVPAAVAADLMAQHKLNPEPLVRLAAVLELVNKIYPAIDTAAADILLNKLLKG
ncbi:MAG TPA: hypothetical protein VLF21_03240 [Candidatus Saccharimonadales bacterium]|nr:hypothetical protein [Candidatus Saccharimonadales bacterium]